MNPQLFTGITNVNPTTATPTVTKTPAVQGSYVAPQPQQFAVPPTNTYPSSSLNGGMTPGQLLDMQETKRQQMASSQNTNLVPSDGYMKQIYNGIMDNSQYSDQEKQLIQSNADLNAKIYNTQLQERRQIKSLQENGMITKEQAASFISESQRRADAQNADQAGLSMFNTTQLGALAAIRGNNLTAFQNAGNFITANNQQVAPGSTIYNPLLGGVQYSGMGASPAQIASQASTFIAQDQSTGQLKLDANGAIDQNYYQQRAQQYYAGGVRNSAGSSVQGGSSQGKQGVLPPNIANQPYVVPGTANTPSYINLGRVPKGQEQYVAQVAGSAGIPVLDSNDSENVQGIQKTLQAIQPLEVIMGKTLSSGVLGRGINIAKNTLNNIFQNQPELVSFNQARTTAINVIQSLAAGAGSGFRLTQPEIDTATANMPVATDNLETAQKKLTYVKSYLNNQLALKLTGNANNLTSPEQGGNQVQGANVYVSPSGTKYNLPY